MRQTAVLLSLLFLFGCSKKAPPSQATPVAVRIAVAEVKDVPIFLEGLGHVDSVTTIHVRSRIEGELTGVYFKQGQEVKAGDLLFTIDPKPYEAALKQAQGTLEGTLANLAISEERVKRYKALANDEYYSQIDYETLQSNFATNTGTVQQNQAAVDSAAINLDYCWIYAPIDGMVGILQVDYGNLVTAGDQTLVTLNQMAPIYVTFSIPENQLPLVQKYGRTGDVPLKVLAAYESFKDEVFEGSLYMVDNMVDEETGMIKIRGIFENKNRELWPGQFVRARLLLHTQKNAVVIPHFAVQMTLNGPMVFVVNDSGVVEQKAVKLGQRQEDTVIVLSGLQGGERIATDGLINLYSGAKVSIKGQK